MFRKMLFICGLLLPFLLVVNVITVHADEANKLEAVAETNESPPIDEDKTKVETPRRQNKTSGSNKKSIRMIVGGQSKDGVAKSINLPIDKK